MDGTASTDTTPNRYYSKKIIHNMKQNRYILQRFTELKEEQHRIKNILQGYTEGQLHATEREHLERKVRTVIINWLTAIMKTHRNWRTLQTFLRKVLMYVKLFLGMRNLVGDNTHLIIVDFRMLEKHNIDEIVVDTALLVLLDHACLRALAFVISTSFAFRNKS